MINYRVSFPTILTLIRLVISPLFLPFLLVLFLPQNIFKINVVLAAIFVLLSLTDFFDGYFARKYKQESTMGKLLDPLADKFLFFSTLIALLAARKLFFYWPIVFIGREFFIVGLRAFAAEHGLDVPVSWRGKMKTVAQLAYATIVIINPYKYMSTSIWSQYLLYNGVEFLALLIALLLSWWSAYYYYRAFLRAYRVSYKQAEVSMNEQAII